jgi:hypothetical protein
MSKLRPGPPAAYAGHRGVLLGALVVGLFLLGLLAFPVVAGAAEALVDTVLAVHDSFDWEPF